jgi:hypothetical protein
MKEFKMLSRRNGKPFQTDIVRAKTHQDAIFFLMRDKYRIPVKKGNPHAMLRRIDQEHGIFIFSPDETDENGKFLPTAMRVTLGEDGLKRSYQRPFDKGVPCPKCGGNARIAFVADEMPQDNEKPRGPLRFVCNLHPNDSKVDGVGSGYWWHDACSVAVYLCEDCFEAVAKTNQA